MRRQLVSMIALLAFVLAVPIDVDADMDLPAIDVGDSWTYEIMVSQLGMVLDGEVITQVEGETSSHGHTVYHLSLDGSGTVESSEGNGTFDMWGHQYLRKSDLAEVELNASQRVDLNTTAIQVTTWFYSELVHDPPNNRFDFPTAVGEEWSVVSEATRTDTIISLLIRNTNITTNTVYTNYTCEKTEMVTVPAGSFSSYKIMENRSTEGYGHWYVSPDVGLLVKMESFDDADELVMEYELKSYSYSPGNGNGGNGETDGGIVSLIMDNLMWIIITIVIVIVVAGAALGLSRRSRGKLPPEEEPPVEPEESEPPPSE